MAGRAACRGRPGCRDSAVERSRWNDPAIWAASVPSHGTSPLDSSGTLTNSLGSEPPAGAIARPLPFFYDLYTFRGDEGATTVIAAFSVPVGKLKREWENRAVQYRFDVSLVLSDTALHSVSRTDDSAFVSVPRPLSSKHLLFTHVEVQAQPSLTTLQRVIMTDASTPGIGQLYSTPFAIPDYSGTDLMLSDIAMGHPDAIGGWERGDVTLALLPTSQFPGSSFDLFYEIYNLPFGSRYTTEVSIEGVDESGVPQADEENEVRISFSGESNAFPGDPQDELRHVAASLEEGRYRITVTVTDEDSGQSATQSRLFQVLDEGRGVTMVPALPAKRMG